MRLEDLDFSQARLKVRGGLKSNERWIPLKAVQIGLLMHYVQSVRIQLLGYHTRESDRLFLSLPEVGKAQTESQQLMGVFKALTRQLRSIDERFVNFKQLRASLIIYWLKTQGLRKAQYLAGHRYISSTEAYLPNDIEGLAEDIARLHPF